MRQWVRVRDTGMGIRQNVLPHVFDLFVQGPRAIDHAQGGLGLGLTIVKNLVEAHGGRVSAHSDGIDQGSEFVVSLPVARQEPRAAGRLEDGGPVSAPAAAARARVLIVDDNADAAAMIAEALTFRGFETRSAHDGLEALQQAREFRPDAAFLDIGLPVMDGYELAGRLREIPGLETLTLIAVTGYGQDEDRRRSAGAGFQHHLVKPVDLDELEALLSDERR